MLRLLAAGRTNAQIGAELYISPTTAGVHVTNILRKLGVTSRVQAAALAERAGLLHTRAALNTGRGNLNTCEPRSWRDHPIRAPLPSPHPRDTGTASRTEETVMHPTFHHELANARVADLHRQAAAGPGGQGRHPRPPRASHITAPGSVLGRAVTGLARRVLTLAGGRSPSPTR